MNVRNKARIILFGLLLIIVINLTRGLVLGSFPGSLCAVTISIAFLFSLGGMYVGWKIKTPSWGDAIVFGIACVVILNLLPILILHRPFTARTIAVLVSVFVGALAGVLFFGYLARRLERFNSKRKVLRWGAFCIGFLVVAILVVCIVLNAIWGTNPK